VTTVGILYNGTMEPDTLSGAARPDHVVVIPERFWSDAGRTSRPRYTYMPGPRRVLERLLARGPVAAHGLGLSIASACFFDRAHLRELQSLDREVGFSWISEHLAAFRVDHNGGSDHHAGVPTPLPWGPELLDLVSERVDEVQETLGRTIMLENGVEFTPIHDPEMSEVEFWQHLHSRTGVEMLLDLHNLYVNEVNLGVNSETWLESLPRSAVKEIHVAGGNWVNGTYFDSHATRSPSRVLTLLRLALGRFPDVHAITFELHGS